MATVGELTVKLNVEMLGMEELNHLLEMLKANIDVLPTIVVQALSDLVAASNQEDESNV